MDDRILALCELSNDLLFHKIPQGRLPYYINASLSAGQSAAQAFGGQDIRQLYQSRGIAVRYAGKGKQGYGIILRGQCVMAKDHCSVDVYQDSIRELAAHSGWAGRRLTEEQALEIHLAHEFFHIWEYQEHRSIVDALEPVVSASFLGLKRKSHISRCGEVAAHAFAKELLGLPFLPNLYDYRYLLDTGAMDQADFDGLMARMAALIGQVPAAKEKQPPCRQPGGEAAAE